MVDPCAVFLTDDLVCTVINIWKKQVQNIHTHYITGPSIVHAITNGTYRPKNIFSVKNYKYDNINFWLSGKL